MTSILYRPAKGNITNGFRSQPSGGKASHLALDFGWGNGYEVYAAETGTISYDESIGYGKRLSIVHKKTISGKQTITRYAHLNTALVKSGTVQRGQLIGRMGNTGTFAEFDHLHFELLLAGKKSNPINCFTDTAGNGTTPTPQEDAMSSMIAVREPGGGIALVGETTYQNLDLAGWTAAAKIFGNFIQVTLADYKLLIAHSQVRRAYLLAAFTGGSGAAVDVEALIKRIDANVDADLAKLSTQIAQINNVIGAPTKEQIAAAVDAALVDDFQKVNAKLDALTTLVRNADGEQMVRLIDGLEDLVSTLRQN